MSNSIVKNAVIVLGVEQGKTNFKLDLDPALKARAKQIKQLKELEGRLKAVEVVEEKEADTAKKAAEEQIKAIEESRRAQEDLAKFTVSSHRAILGATQQAGEGVLGIARAFVLLGISSEDNLRKVIQSLARVQAAFDIFRGVSNIIKSVITVTKTLAAVEAAETAAKSANTTATQANTTAKLANVAASRAQLLIFTPVGAAVAAGTALVVAAVFALRDQTDAIEDNIVAQRKRAQELQRNRDLERLGTDIGTPESRANEARREALEANRARRLLAGDTRAEAELSEAKAILADFPDVAAIGTDVDAVAIATLRIAEAQKAVNEERELAERSTSREIEQQRRLLDIEKKRIQTQKDRTQGNQAALGRLDRVDRTAFDISFSKVIGGKASRSDLDRVGSVGGDFGKVAQRGFAALGQDAQGLLGRAGILPSGERTEETIKEISDSGNRLKNGVRDVFDVVNSTLSDVLEQMGRIVDKVDDIDDQIAKGAL